MPERVSEASVADADAASILSHAIFSGVERKRFATEKRESDGVG